MENIEMIGQMVEYEAGGRLYRGRILDKVRIIGKREDAGQAFDLYVIECDHRIFKISPAQIKQLIT